MAVGSKVTEAVLGMALPIAQAEGCTVYDVEYKKEGSDYILRVILDTFDDAVPVSITMCENVSRALSEALDGSDPTSSPYILEVTSPGLDRPLKKDEDFVRFAGKEIEIGLYKQLNGTKLLCGTLIGLEDGAVAISVSGEKVAIKREDASFVRLAVIF